MSPDHWSKLTWDTVSAGGYDFFDPDPDPPFFRNSLQDFRYFCCKFLKSIFCAIIHVTCLTSGMT